MCPFSERASLASGRHLGAANFLALPIGPILGGWLLSHYWWGWVFLLNVPVALIGLIAALTLVPESRAPVRPGLDPVGIVASTAGLAGSDYAPVCPASGYWHLLFLRQHGSVNVSVVGPLTKATPVTQAEGTSWFGITFALGTFLPVVPVRNLLDEQAMLPLAAKTSFSLAGSSFQFPDYDNAETFVDRLVRENLLMSDEIVKAVLAGHRQEVSFLFKTRSFCERYTGTGDECSHKRRRTVHSRRKDMRCDPHNSLLSQNTTYVSRSF